MGNRRSANYRGGNDEHLTVVAVRKDNDNVITDFKLSDGRILSKERAVEVAKREGLEGINVSRTRGEHSVEILRANPTNDISRSLYDFPTF